MKISIVIFQTLTYTVKFNKVQKPKKQHGDADGPVLGMVYIAYFLILFFLIFIQE